MKEFGVIYLLEVLTQELGKLPPTTVLTADVLRNIVVKVTERLTGS